MNLVLIGYRGTGKSAAGNILGEMLNRPVISMDEEIVCEEGCSIPETVEKHGWSYFRDVETRVAKQLAGQDGLIIDCGGGVIERDENIPALKQNGVVFWLKASTPVIVKRIEGGTDRPALVEGKTFTEEVEEVLERRAPLYAAAADHEIDTDRHSPQDTADAVAEIWNAL